MRSPMAWPLFLVGLLVAVLSGCATPTGPAAPATSLPTVVSPTPTVAVPPPEVGASQRWIEADLAAQVVRLREGDTVLAEYPAASGVAVTSESATQPGVYRVQQMIQGPIENVPGVFVSDILIYDLAAGVGIHSIPMDRDGNALDVRLGRPASWGCVRVGESAAVFAFAQLGMVVWVH